VILQKIFFHSADIPLIRMLSARTFETVYVIHSQHLYGQPHDPIQATLNTPQKSQLIMMGGSSAPFSTMHSRCTYSLQKYCKLALHIRAMQLWSN